MKTLLLLILSYSFTTLAQVQVQMVDPELDSKPLEGKGYKISREESEFNSLPDKAQRDRLLSEVPDSKSWDELAKDIFYMDLKSKTLEQLAKKYPSIKKSTLKQLKVKRG